MSLREEALKEVAKARESGEYKVASLDMLDKINELELSENLQLHLEYTEDMLEMYLRDIQNLKDCKPGLNEFLKGLKVNDVVDNQGFEYENTFLVALYSQIPNETAMERLIKFQNTNHDLTDRDIFSLHNTLLYGTLSQGERSIRTKNDKFVGKFEDGERLVDYFPIDYRDVWEAARQITKLYNTKLDGELYDNVLFKPFLIHGLVSALQIFNDGNTRMGRIMQHALIWKLINDKTEFNFDLPPVYATRSYYPYRYEYREKIANLVKNNDQGAWDDWFEFNLYRIEDAIDVGRENARILKRKIEYTNKF